MITQAITPCWRVGEQRGAKIDRLPLQCTVLQDLGSPQREKKVEKGSCLLFLSGPLPIPSYPIPSQACQSTTTRGWLASRRIRGLGFECARDNVHAMEQTRLFVDCKADTINHDTSLLTTVTSPTAATINSIFTDSSSHQPYSVSCSQPWKLFLHRTCHEKATGLLEHGENLRWGDRRATPPCKPPGKFRGPLLPFPPLHLFPWANFSASTTDQGMGMPLMMMIDDDDPD